MKKTKIFLLSLIVICFLFSLVNVKGKYQTENSSNNVELVADYRHLYLNETKVGESFGDDMLYALKNAGVTTIGLNENTMKELEVRNLLFIMDGHQFKKELWSQEVPFEINENHTYVVIPKGEKQTEIINTIQDSKIGSPKIYQINDVAILEFQQSQYDLENQPLLYLQSDIKKLSKYFYLAPRISNGWKDRISLIENQLQQLDKEKKLSPVIFQGEEVVGFDDKTNKVKLDSYLLSNKLGVIEVYDDKQSQKGLNSYALNSNYNIVRVMSVPEVKLQSETPRELNAMIMLAANERNIRMFYINVPSYSFKDKKSDYLNKLGDSISNISTHLKEKGYKLNQANPFDYSPNNLNQTSTVMSILGAMYLFFYAAVFLLNKWSIKIKPVLLWLAFISGTIASILNSFGGPTGLYKAVASLGITILIPVWSSLIIMNVMEKDKKNIFKEITVPIVGMYIAGISMLTAINYHIAFMTHLYAFRGVSLTLLLPPLISAIIVGWKLKGNMRIREILNHKITIVDLVVVALIGAFAYLLESRSGNGGTMLPFEAQIRFWLENQFPARPRTKEIFFAFPVLAVTILLWKQSKWVKALLPLAVIGLASVFNTFTHFHTPLYFSMVRTLISVGYGLFIGGIAATIIFTVIKTFDEVKGLFPTIEKKKKEKS